MKQSLNERVYPLLVALYGGLRNGFALFLCGASLGWLMGMTTSPVLQTVLTALLAIVTTLLTATLGLPKSGDDTRTSLTDTLSGLSGKMLGQPVSEKSDAPVDDQPERVPPVTKPVRAYNALPLGWFLFCLTAGAAGGIFTRTNELLGTIPHVVAGRLGISPADSALIARQILTEQYNLGVAKSAKDPTNGKPVSTHSEFRVAALFSDTRDLVDFCESVRGQEGLELQDELNDQIVRRLNRKPTEPERRGLEQMQQLLARKPDERVLQQIKDQLCTHR